MITTREPRSRRAVPVPAALVWAAAAGLLGGVGQARGVMDFSDDHHRGPILTLTGGIAGLLDEDMHRTYGTLPSYALRCGLPLGPASELIVGAGYLEGTGNPYYDIPGFSGGRRAFLRAGQLELGLRARPARRLVSGFGVGLMVQHLLVSERVPGTDYSDPARRGEVRTSGWGFRLLLSQEWMLPGLRWAAGVEGSLGMGLAPMSRYEEDRQIDLSGYDVRGCVSYFP